MHSSSLHQARTIATSLASSKAAPGLQEIKTSCSARLWRWISCVSSGRKRERKRLRTDFEFRVLDTGLFNVYDFGNLDRNAFNSLEEFEIMEGQGEFFFDFGMEQTFAGEWVGDDFDMNQYLQQNQETINPALLAAQNDQFNHLPPLDPDQIQAELRDLFPEQFDAMGGAVQQQEQESFELGPEFAFFQDDNVANQTVGNAMDGTAPEFGDEGLALPPQADNTSYIDHAMHQTAPTLLDQTMPPVAPAQPPRQFLSSPPPLTYAFRVANATEATAIISRKQHEGPPLPLEIDHDDWQVIEINIQNHAAHLFQALFNAPQAPPPKFDNPTAVQYYWSHENATQSSVIALAMSDPEEAEARVLLVLQEVVNTHKFGIPASAYNRNNKKFGYKVELEMTCSERLNKIIDAATRDKYVAHDILTGTNLVDLVRSPEAYLSKKVYNVQLNAKKAQDKLAAGQAPRKFNLDRKSRGTGTGKGRVSVSAEDQRFGRKNTKGHFPRSRIQRGKEAGQQQEEMKYSPASGFGQQASPGANKRRFDETQQEDEEDSSDTSARIAKMRRMR